MKFETKLNKSLAIENEKLRKLKSISLSFSLFPQSPQQLKVKQLISTL